MKPVGSSAPAFYPPTPAPQTAPPTAGPAEPGRARSPAQAGTTDSAHEPPKLGETKRYRGGRYGHLAEAIVNLKLAEQGVNTTRATRREAGAQGGVALTAEAAQASTSSAPAGRAAPPFQAQSLAQLAQWAESPRTYSVEPGTMYSSRDKVPANFTRDMLRNCHQTLEDGLAEHGIKPEDVVVGQSSRRLDVNLNYLELKQYLGRGKGMWVATDDNNAAATLAAHAAQYMNAFRARATPPLPPVGTLNSKDSLGVMRELLHGAPGLVIGEAHSCVASKRELAKHFKSLKANGVTTLYMEHLCADAHGKALKAYLQAPKGSPMPPRLKAYLDMQTRGNLGLAQATPTHTFTTLVKAAKDAGLDVIPIDTAQTYATSTEGGATRMQVMNYYAAEKMRLSQPTGKWLAFVGSAHTNTFDGVPGLADLLGVRSLIIDDFGERSRPTIQTDVKNYAEKISPDVVLSYKR